MSHVKIAPSILAADFAHLADAARSVEEAGADYIHVDVMDGHFVPNITIGPLIVEAVRSITSLPLDVHLMISNPDSYIQAFAKAGADILTVHVEACTHLHRSVQHIRDQEVRPAVSLNPATPLDTIEYVLEELDMVLIMTVNPGFGGQAFIPAMLSKIRRLREMADRRKKDLEIEVDGGISPETIHLPAEAGADVFVAGSAIFYSEDYAKTIQAMREKITP